MKMTVTFKEIEAFNKGHRDSIFILKSSINKIKRGHSMLEVGTLGVLVVDSPQKIHEYTNMVNEYGEDYALGVILGYPPKCVLSFSRASQMERKKFGTLVSGTFSFKCSEGKMRALEFGQLYEVLRGNVEVYIQGESLFPLITLNEGEAIFSKETVDSIEKYYCAEVVRISNYSGYDDDCTVVIIKNEPGHRCSKCRSKYCHGDLC